MIPIAISQPPQSLDRLDGIGSVVGLRKDRETRRRAMLRWGLVPFWSDDPGSWLSMINAQAETVRTKPAFRAAFREWR